jgi:hypothetical protein
MGICDSDNNDKKYVGKFPNNKGKQLFSAPIGGRKNDNTNNLTTTINTISQVDIQSLNHENKIRPSLLYKYKSSYCNKGEQISVMTETLQDLQGNSIINNKTENNNTRAVNSINTFVDENDSSNGFEIISEGVVDEDMVQKSTDKSTIDSYIEFIGQKNKFNSPNNKIDVYHNNKKSKKNNKLVEHCINKKSHWRCSKY